MNLWTRIREQFDFQLMVMLLAAGTIVWLSALLGAAREQPKPITVTPETTPTRQKQRETVTTKSERWIPAPVGTLGERIQVTTTTVWEWK